jgi:hypothetical protein
VSELDIPDKPVRIRRSGNYIEPSVPHQFRTEIFVVHWRGQQHARMIWPGRQPFHVKPPVVFRCGPVVDSNRSPKLIQYLQSSFHCSDHPRFPSATSGHFMNREEKIVISCDYKQPYQVLIFRISGDLAHWMARS